MAGYTDGMGFVFQALDYGTEVAEILALAPRKAR